VHLNSDDKQSVKNIESLQIGQKPNLLEHSTFYANKKQHLPYRISGSTRADSYLSIAALIAAFTIY